jgi:transcriptional regulator with XRE-family HTH domain
LWIGSIHILVTTLVEFETAWYLGDKKMYLFGERLREIRKLKNLSQGDLERRTGLNRSYISRVEHGHSVPMVKTVEKFARALEMPTYQLFYDGAGTPPRVITMNNGKGNRQKEWGETGRDALYMRKLQACLGQMSNEDRIILRSVLQRMARKAEAKRAA